MRLQVVSSNSTYYWSVTNAAPAKPYLQISNQYLPLTTATRSGIKLKVQSGNTTYRAAVYESGYYNTTSAAVGNLSSTTALTRSSTSATLTRSSTSATLTRSSTSATLTRSSTSATLTRSSTSATLTRSSTSATLTRSSISGYATGSSTVNYTVPTFSAPKIYMRMTHAEIYYYVGNLGTVAHIRLSTANDLQTAFNYTFKFPDNYISLKSSANKTAYRVYSQYWSKPYEYAFYTYQPNGSITESTSRTLTDTASVSTFGLSRMMTLYSGFNNTSPIHPRSFSTNKSNLFSTTSVTTFNSTNTRIDMHVYTSELSYQTSGQGQQPMYNGTSYVGTFYYTTRSLYKYDEIYAYINVSVYSTSVSSSSTKQVTTATLTRSSISGYATRSSISGYATRSSISGYATRSSISGYATRSSISGYATRSSISGYATRSSISGYSGKLSSSKWG